MCHLWFSFSSVNPFFSRISVIVRTAWKQVGLFSRKSISCCEIFLSIWNLLFCRNDRYPHSRTESGRVSSLASAGGVLYTRGYEEMILMRILIAEDEKDLNR